MRPSPPLAINMTWTALSITSAGRLLSVTTKLALERSLASFSG
jgi:hypothetical protein